MGSRSDDIVYHDSVNHENKYSSAYQGVYWNYKGPVMQIVDVFFLVNRQLDC